MIQRFCRIALFGVLILTAGLKLFDNTSLEQGLRSFRLPSSGLAFAAVVELLLAIVLITPFFQTGMRFILAISSIAVIYLATVRLLQVDLTACGCFGTRRVGWGGHLALLSGMMALSLSAIMAEASRPELEEGVPLDLVSH